MAKKLKSSLKTSLRAPDSVSPAIQKHTSKLSEPAVQPDKKKKVTDEVLEKEANQNQTKRKNAEGSGDLSKTGSGKKRKKNDTASVTTETMKNPNPIPPKSEKSGKKFDTPSVIHVEADEAKDREEEDGEWNGFDGRGEVKSSLDGGEHPAKTHVLSDSGSIVQIAVKKPRSKKTNPEPEQEPDPDSDEGSGDGDDDEENVYLHGFSSDNQDSSDEDDMVDAAPPLDVKKLPTIAKDDKVVKQKLDKAKRQQTEDRGVIYLSRIPHGFYEDQMKAYFTQFGDVTRLRLSRNKKTGHSKHYGYVEFESSRVAEIVAETMDNYLLMGHILRCKIIPKNEVHPALWVGANKKFRVVPRALLERNTRNKPRTPEEQRKAGERLIRRQESKKIKLAKKGIEYNFDLVGYKKSTAAES